MSDYIDIVFDGPPGHVAPGFVEVEDSAGRSIKAGEWLQRDDSYWVLRIDRPEQEGVAAGHPEPSAASTPPLSIADIVEGYTDILSPETARKVGSRIRGITPSSSPLDMERMREALERAGAAFERYAKGHREKNTVEGEQKAAANDHMAYVCRAALSGSGKG